LNAATTCATPSIRYSLINMGIVVAEYAYPRRDGQAESTWVTH